MISLSRSLRMLRRLQRQPVGCERIYRQISAGIEASAIEALRARARAAQKHEYEKYLDFPYYLRLNISRALALGLDDGKRRRVLDIGCGAGYFLLTCRHLGHSVRGLDLDRIAVFNESVALFDIPRVVHEIRPFEPLPGFDEPFDLITAFAAKFERYDSPPGTADHIWGSPEWAFFLKDVRERLAPGGIFHMKLNVTADHFNRKPELRELFEHANGYKTQFHDKKRLSLQRVG